MMLRQERYGEFWGCPKFPDCRGTRPIKKTKPATRYQLYSGYLAAGSGLSVGMVLWGMIVAIGIALVWGLTKLITYFSTPP
jgi:hypothetical protein